MKTSYLTETLILLLLLAASAVALTLIQPPASLSFLAWIALVPFILAALLQVNFWKLLLAAYLVAAAYWLGNLWWVAPITVAGWLAFCLYTALLWPALVLAIRFAAKISLPLLLVVPVLIVGAERLQGFILGGFFWRMLGHSQFQNLAIIQIADIFGAAGVSFIIAMVNALIAELAISAKHKNLLCGMNVARLALTAAVIIAATLYGDMRLNETPDHTKSGPAIASVQSNVPQSVKKSFQASDKIFENVLALSRAAARTKPDLIIWPETMVQAPLNPDALNILASTEPAVQYNRTLKNHADEQNLWLLVGAYAAKLHITEEYTAEYAEKYNSAFLYGPDGTKCPRRYDKIHLVPFGEVVPFKKSIPWLYNILMTFSPYDYDYSLDYGQNHTVFEITPPNEPNAPDYNFSALICYEDTTPDLARDFALDKNGHKQIDFFINISNDGWFVSFEDGKTTPTSELPQHVAAGVFRAVENRLPVVRSVNTGISCIIDSTGNVRDGYIKGTLPHKALARQAMAGWFTDTVAIDSRTTFFSRHGRWLDMICAIGFICLAAASPAGWLIRRGRNAQKAEKITKNERKIENV